MIPGVMRNEDMENRRRQEIDATVQAALANQGVLQGMIPSPEMGYPPPTAPLFNRPPEENNINPMWTGTVLDKKLSMIKIGDFNGSDEDWLKWSKRVRSAFGEAGMSTILTSTRTADANAEANERIYWKLEGSTANGAAKTMVSQHQESKSGHKAWRDLLITYEGDGVLVESAQKVRNRLDTLRLNTTTTALEYIAEFQECISMLEDMKEGYTISKTREMFLEQITDSDYHEVTHSLRFHDMTIEDCYKKVRKEQSLLSLRQKKNIRPRKVGISENGTNQSTDMNLTKFKDEKGYMNVPKTEWTQLTDRQRSEVKRFNGNLKWKRRQNSNSGDGDRNQKILRRAVIDILQEVVETKTQNRDDDPNISTELNNQREITPKFVFQVKKA